MALTRKMLKAMGIEDEKIDQIIDAHTETVDGLKGDAAKYKGDAEKLPGVQKELDALKAAGDGGYKEKYEAEHKDFEDFKKTVQAKEARAAKETAYRALLREAGISEKRIDAVLKVSDMGAVELEGGKIKDAERLKDAIRQEWADFVVKETAQGAQTANPPVNAGGGSLTKHEIAQIKDPAERRAAIAANMTLFEKGQ